MRHLPSRHLDSSDLFSVSSSSSIRVMGSRYYDAPFAYSDTKIILSLHQPSAEDNTNGRVVVESPTSPLTPEWPAALRQIDLSSERYFHPQTPDPLSFVRITGRRRALIIGINYIQHPDPQFQLKGCTADAYGITNFLLFNLGFAPDDVHVITDENPWNLPTKKNILEAMRALVHDAQPQDSFFFYFSGHGIQIKDMDGDESDGLDECICAMDYIGDDPHPNPNTPGLIVDDIMHEIMVKPLPPQCRLTAIFDSCHSGTVLDLPYLYDSKGAVKPFGYMDGPWVLHEKASYANVVSLSGSKDNQKAVETNRGGALKWAFIECMKNFDNTLTYKELIRNVREHMKRHGLSQRPQLSSSYEMDTNLQFIV